MHVLFLTIAAAITLLYAACYVLSSLKLPPEISLWESPPPVSVLKPVRGLDEDAEANFRSFFLQRYPAQWELIFALESRQDPALPVLNRLIKEYPQVSARIVISPAHGSYTGKMANVITAYRHAAHPFIVVSDSDMQVPADFLLRMVSPLRDPTVGLVGSIPVYTGAKTPWSQALLVYAHLFGICFAGSILELQLPGKFAAGNQALRAEVLESVGGFTAIAGYLSEDVRLAQLIRQRGLRIVYSAMAVSPVPALRPEDLIQVLARYQSASRSLSLPLYIFTNILALGHWLTLAGIGLTTAMGAGPGWLWAVACAPILVRGLVAWLLHLRWAGPVSFLKTFTAALALDGCFLVAAWNVLLGKPIYWRGICYRCLNDGRVQRVSDG